MKAILFSLACCSLLAGVGRTESLADYAVEARLAPIAGSWRARATDNVCGLSDLRMLSNPATVRFDQLLKATPEMKKLDRDSIDPLSPEGVQLRDDARKRVTKACESVRVQNAHCSVWRTIRHSDGTKPTDITKLVRAKL